MGSNILAPGLHYIGAQAPIYWSPLSQKNKFLFYFLTRNTANKSFPVHLVDHHVTQKSWFYQNSLSSFLPRILNIKFRGSNILEPGSNILEPPHLPDCLFYAVFVRSVLTQFTRFCVEKNLVKKWVGGEKMTNIRYASKGSVETIIP